MKEEDVCSDTEYCIILKVDAGTPVGVMTDTFSPPPDPSIEITTC
jgi:hypothetical protein